MIYIYALSCPLTKRTRYIGKCKNVQIRLKSHISKARYGETQHHCARWISTLLKRGLSPAIRVLITLPADADWQFAEQVTIARYRRHGFHLTNLTAGGDGFHDLPPDLLQRRIEAQRKWFAIPENRERILAALTAGRDTPEHRIKLSKLISAGWRRPTTKAAYLEGMRKPDAVLRRMAASARRFEDDEYRRRHSANMAAIWSRSERRQEARERAIAVHSNPEIVERRRASLKASHQRPSVKLRMKAARDQIAARPDVKQKKSDKARQSWADPEASAKRRAALSSDECRAKMSTSAKNRWKDPKKVAKALASFSDPESRARRTAAAQNRSTPEYRAMMAAKTKAAWASGKRKKRDANASENDRGRPLL